MVVRINTSVVSATAEEINIINKKMREELSDVDAVIRALQQGWEGDAARSSIEAYGRIKNNFSETRFSVVNDMVSFMKNQVGEAYETTERLVSTAASAFK